MGIARRFGVSVLKSAEEHSLETEATLGDDKQANGQIAGFEDSSNSDLKVWSGGKIDGFECREGEDSEDPEIQNLGSQIRSIHIESHSELYEELKSKSYRRIMKKGKQIKSEERVESPISNHDFENYERIEYIDNILITDQSPNIKLEHLNEKVIGINSELEKHEFRPKHNIDFKNKGKSQNKVEMLYLEAYLNIPNYASISMIEKKLIKFTSTIKNLEIRSHFFNLINYFRMIRTDTHIETLKLSDNLRLNSGHWELKESLKPVQAELETLLSLTLINGDFQIAQEIMSLVDDFGFEMISFARTIFKSAPMGAKSKDYAGLTKMLEMAAEMIRREVDYLNLLFQLLKQRTRSQKISQIAATLEGSKQIFRDLEMMLSASPLEKDLYEGVLNLGWVRPNESVEDLCKRFPDFKRKFGRQLWFNAPKVLDFEVDLNQIEDEELLLQLEFLHFLKDRVGRASKDDFRKIFTEETFLLNILINMENNENEQMALSAASSLDAFLRVKSYSSAKAKLETEMEVGSKIRHQEYANFFEVLVRSVHARGRLTDFVSHNLYFVHFYFSKPEIILLDDEIRQNLVTAIFEVDLSDYPYLDQIMVIDLCFDSLEYSHLFQEKQVVALSRKIFVMLNLPNNNNYIDLAVSHAHSIASIFSENPEVLRLLLRYISKSIPSEFFNNTKNSFFKKASKMHTVFKLMEALGLRDDISDFGLDGIKLLCDFDCLAKQRGLYNRDLGNMLRNFRVTKQGCHETFTREQFAGLVNYATGEYLIEEQLVEAGLLLDDGLRQIVCEELGGRLG